MPGGVAGAQSDILTAPMPITVKLSYRPYRAFIVVIHFHILILGIIPFSGGPNNYNDAHSLLFLSFLINCLVRREKDMSLSGRLQLQDFISRSNSMLERRGLMRDLVWNNTLNTGVDEVDDDHRKLVNLYNILNHSLTSKDAPEYLDAILEELINCSTWHFSHEERLMLKYGYEGYAEHKAEHRKLIKSAKGLRLKILHAGNLVADEDIEFLEHWLTEHILTTDRKMGLYLAMESVESDVSSNVPEIML
jgi:hemerythrin